MMIKLKHFSYLLVFILILVTTYVHVIIPNDFFGPQNGENIILSHVPNSTIFQSKDFVSRRPLLLHLGSGANLPQEHVDCNNQSTCVSPIIEVTKTFNIYLCRKVVDRGERFFYLLNEGLMKHRGVKLVDHMSIADFIIYCPSSAPWHKSECTDTSLADKLIVLDESDGSFPFSPRKNEKELRLAYPDKIIENNVMWYFAFFKRSYVHRKDGRFIRYPFMLKKDFFPMVYSIADKYIRPEFNRNRQLLLACTLRGDPKWQPSRLRVLEWIDEYVERNKLSRDQVVTTQVNKALRKSIDATYFNTMYNARIVITANPANWEGDFRLWEALSSGALVFVDELSTPAPYPLVHEKHLIFFSTLNKTDFINKLDFYISHPDSAERIANTGYMHALQYHRTVNFIDYVLKTVHVKQMNLETARRSKFSVEHLEENVLLGRDADRAGCYNYTQCGQEIYSNLRRALNL